MEIEFKFRIPSGRLPAVEAALRRGPVRRTRLQARYFDTASGALAAAGTVLRLRKEGRRWVQTVKAAGGGPLQRWEHNVDLGPSRAGVVPQADPARHAGTPVGERLAALLAQAGEPLRDSHSTDIWRLTRQMRYRGATVELALDTGRAMAQGRSAPVCELELELLRGDVAGLVALAHAWSQRHGLWFSTVSKAERGERLLRAAEAPGAVPAVKAQAMRYEEAAPDGTAIQRAVLANCLAQVLPNAGEVAEGSTDAEQVHQLRIGLRRLRTALRMLDALAPGLDPAWQAPLAALFRTLGAERDRALVLGQAQAALADAQGPAVDFGASAEACADLCAAVRDSGFQDVLVRLIGHGAQQAADGGLDAPAARRQLKSRLQALHRKTVRDAARFDALTPEARHAVRKRLKRLRYLSEFAAPLFEAARAADYLERLRSAQDALGALNDLQVAQALYRAAAGHDPRAWFGVGWLQAQLDPALHEAQRMLRRIGKARRFWTKRG